MSKWAAGSAMIPIPCSAEAEPVEPTPPAFTVIVFVVASLLALRMLPRLIAGVPFVEPLELKQRLDEGDNILVLDVRYQGDFSGRQGHVPGAMNVPLLRLWRRVRRLDADLAPFKGDPVYVIDQRRGLAPYAARLLKRAGFTDVKVVKGGMRGWYRWKFPVEKAG